MRIDRLDLVAYGPFTDIVLDLSAGSEGLHLVYGPNEAGKSSALRAIRQLYRGIDVNSVDNFVHDHQRMRIGARLRDRAGTTLEMIRRKGNKNTLLDTDGTPLADGGARIARFFGGISPDDFEGRFAIAHKELVEGGKAIVAGKGDLGSLLFAAGGSHLAGVNRALEALEEEADELFKSKGKNPRINERLAELAKLNGQIKDASVPSVEWRERDEAHRNAQARKVDVEDELARATREQNRLQQISKAIEATASRKVVIDELSALEGVPRLSDDFTEKRREAQRELRQAENDLAEARCKIEQLSTEAETLCDPSELLDEDEAIEGLYMRVGSLRQAATDSVENEAERSRREADARSILRELGRDPGLFESEESLESLRVTALDKETVSNLIGNHQLIRSKRDEAEKTLKTHADKCEKAAAKLDELGPERDPTTLKKVLKLTQKQGDLDDQIQQKREELRSLVGRVRIDTVKLGLQPDLLDTVESLPVPSSETIERFREEFDAADGMIKQYLSKSEQTSSKSRENESKIESVQLQGGVPTEEALAEARRERDDVWARLKHGWYDDLAAGYELLVRAADELADRLRREAERVSEYARSLGERTRLRDEQADVQRKTDLAHEGRRSLESRWFELWAPLVIDSPKSPKEMLGWLKKQDALSALARSAREKADEVCELEERTSRHHTALRDALRALGEELVEALKIDALRTAIDRGEEVIEAIKKESKAREKAEDTSLALQSEHPAIKDAARTARAAWDDWQAQWGNAMKRIDLPVDTLPVAVNSELSRRAELFEKLKSDRDLRASIEKSRRATKQFTDEASALAGRVAPDLIAAPGFDPISVVETLHKRLKDARTERQKRDSLTTQLDEKKKTASTAQDQASEQLSLLATLRSEARCETDDQLPEIEERSRRRNKKEKELSDRNLELTKLASGVPLESFVTEVEQADTGGLPAQIADLGEKIRALGDERSKVLETVGGTREKLKAMDGGAKAADLSQEAEDLRAKIKLDVEHYARLRLARTILHEAIERYRKKAQGPVLARAESIFSALTLGSFKSLRVEFDDDDRPVLKTLRSGSEDPLGLEALSLGTADQLYLALRLATLEIYLKSHEPLPLIVDDILIQFDDDRAVAAMKILAELSLCTQVLVFTHHEHLVSLARDNIDSSRLFTHTLKPSFARSKLISTR
jgi:uncharacterized protein YhaN